jgi:hypothetical protein
MGFTFEGIAAYADEHHNWPEIQKIAAMVIPLLCPEKQKPRYRLLVLQAWAAPGALITERSTSHETCNTEEARWFSCPIANRENFALTSTIHTEGGPHNQRR